MVKKVIVDNIVFSLQKIGGISVVWYELLQRMLKDDRFDVQFLDRTDSISNFCRKDLNIPSDRIKYCKMPLLVDRYFNPSPKIEEKHLFHSTYYRTSRNKNAINITTIHDFVYERVYKKNFRNKIHIWQQKKAAMNADHIICISENTKRDLLYFYKGIDPNKVHVIYNGVSDSYSVIPNEELENIKLPFPKQSYVLFVGSRLFYKNFDLTVKSLVDTKYNLLIVGNPLNEIEQAFLNNTLGEGRYCCMSKVPNERLNELYNGAFCLVYPSSYEGFGIPCLEAQKAGCPVIGYNNSSIPEVVSDHNMLINKLNVESIKEKYQLLDDEERRAAIVKDGIPFAQQFSWDRTYKELTELYINWTT